MKYFVFCFLGLLICSCRPNVTTVAYSSLEPIASIDSSLLAVLQLKYEEDQDIQFSITPDLSSLVRDSLYSRKDEIFKDNCNWAKDIYEERGFLGYSAVGEEGSSIFWIIVQHCDFDPTFQEEILMAMKPQVDAGNASGKDYAYLVDRVKINSGEKQVYGTQLAYSDDFWITAKPLADSSAVDVRRQEVGLQPLKVYLNDMMQMNYEMNKSVYEERGMTGPNQY